MTVQTAAYLKTKFQSGDIPTETDYADLIDSSVGAQESGSNVPSTRTVNGHALSADVTVTKSDVGLGNVDNVQQMPLSYLDTDGTLAANSDTKVASQKAAKTYIDGIIAAANAMVYKGVVDCSTNPNYPAADAGWSYAVSVAGKIGGASGVNVEVGDVLLCNTDSTASGNQAAVGAYWNVIQKNLDGAVIGPASATDARLASFSGTTGKLIQDAGYAIADLLLKAGGTMAGIIDMAAYQIQNARLTSVRETTVSVSVSSNTITLDLSAGNVFLVSLTANVTTVTISNVPATGSVPITIEFTQDATGGRTVTGWPSGAKWPGGTAPTITATANAVDIISGYTRNGGTTYRLARAHADSK